MVYVLAEGDVLGELHPVPVGDDGVGPEDLAPLREPVFDLAGYGVDAEVVAVADLGRLDAVEGGVALGDLLDSARSCTASAVRWAGRRASTTTG